MKKVSTLILFALIAFGTTAWAQKNNPVSYIYRSWNGSQVVSEERTVTDYIVLSGGNPATHYDLEAGKWYVVSGSIEHSRFIVKPGAPVNLILCDASALTGQITINATSALNVYGQAAGSGKIFAKSEAFVDGEVMAPIGASGVNDPLGGGYDHMGSLTVYGGNVTATVNYWSGMSAAIGGFGCATGPMEDAKGGTVTIYGGTVTATADRYGAGIGGGHGGDGGTVTIYGGTVTAKSDSRLGAGIGGGSNGSGGTVTIWGGTVTAIGGKDAAGIGSGEQAYGNKNGGTITIHGGTVTARGGSHGAGIGGGQDASGGTVVINGGIVNAYGGTDAAGIGSGERYTASSINGGSLTVNGGTVFADGTGWGAGIGGGEDANGATVKIYGGEVTAWAGNDAGKKNGCAIGSEDGDGHRGSLFIGDTLMVHAGQNPTDANSHLFPKETRGAACFFRPYAKIEPCNHQGSSYTVSGTGQNDTHTLHCGHCKSNATHQHTFNDQHVCTVCGVNATTYTVNVYLPVINGDGSYTDGNYGVPITSIMVSGTEIVLPAAPLANEPGGMKFAGWLDVDPPVPIGNLTSFVARSSESLTLANQLYTIDEDKYLIARYNKVSLFNTSGDWNNSNNWYWHEIPDANDTIVIAAEAIIPNGYTAQGGDRIFLDLTGTITIKDGGQLINDVGVWATVEKNIAGHDGSAENGWHFISQPTMNYFKPTESNGFLIEDSTKYDLYYYDEPTQQWRNYKQGENSQTPHFYIETEKGYLYANEAGTTLHMSGTIKPSTTPFTISNLSHSAEERTGFNLVGNPFACNATINRPAYVINGNNVVAYEGNQIVLPPCEGVMVQADEQHESVTFTMTTQQTATNNPGSLNIALTQVDTGHGTAGRGTAETLLDNAIVSFNEGSELGKFYFGTQDANIYIPQDGKDYAIAFVENKTGEMPLNFKANKNGTYTLNFTENVISSAAKKSTFTYLHLIDNLTGADIDLLSEDCGSESAMTAPSYSFTAKTTDYESRFRLVFSATENDGPSTGSGTFAFIDADGNIIVNAGPSTGSGTLILQVFDALGRQVFAEELSTVNYQLSSINFPSGVYVLRLINGENVKTQKIIIE